MTDEELLDALLVTICREVGGDESVTVNPHGLKPLYPDESEERIFHILFEAGKAGLVYSQVGGIGLTAAGIERAREAGCDA